ncbi:choline transporter-like protein 2 [Nasonia vitripennis]|uniref:Choline transporter-like protein n=1 Tax=Nasonia vitripennis TaxID=7425 RepID=A0A7M7IMD2_NASVI|nr:choline transporter-like protein 2 [Nasonia vitripennis]
MAAKKEEKDYGKMIEYDPLWKGPMSEQRTQTDSSFLIAFVVFMCIWIAISVYALIAGDIDESYLNERGRENWYKAAKISIGFSILAGIVSIIFIVLLRWYAKFMVYTAIVVICIGLLGSIIYVGIIYKSMNTGDSSRFIVWLIMMSALLLLIIAFTICYRKKINIACEIIREASKAVMFFPSSLAFPVLPYSLYTAATIYSFIVLLYLSGIHGHTNNGHDETPTHIYLLLVIHIFGYFWLCGFITGFTRMTLSGSFATWYWTIQKAYVPKFTILQCMGTTARYHLGTIAFGSLIIAICQLINALLSYARDKLQSRGNVFACLCFGWYQYLFQNLERFVKFMSKGAYVMSSMHGTGFVQSTKDAFNLYMRNILKVIVANEVTDGVLFLGSLITIGLSVLTTWSYCGSQNLYDIMSIALITAAVFSFLISMAFFTVFKTAVDTIFLCVLEDYERNDGSEEKPYYLSLKLQSLLFKKRIEINV